MIQALVLVLFPVVALRLGKLRGLRALGPVGLCYLAGWIIANTPLWTVSRSTSMTVAEAAVPLAIPLMLVKANVPGWLRGARPTIVAFLLACASSVVMSIVVSLLFAAHLDGIWQLCGMLVGVYIGGSANMNAVGLAVGVSPDVFLRMNAADMMTGGAYFLLLIGPVPRLMAKLLKPPAVVEEWRDDADEESRFNLRDAAVLLVYAALCTGLGAGLSMLVTGELRVGLVILAISTLGIAGSFIPALHNRQSSTEMGEYLLLIFAVALGSLADFRELSGTSPVLVIYVACVMLSIIVAHTIACRIAGIDAHTAVMTSTATIYGPAFVGPVARALGNRQMVVTGLSMALIGIAAANYLGVMSAYVVKALL